MINMDNKLTLLIKIVRLLFISVIAVTIGYVAKDAGIGSGIGMAAGVAAGIYEGFITRDNK